MSTRIHYTSLDGLRGIMAFAVVLFHFQAPKFFFSGAAAVDVFFILSGIVLFENYYHKIADDQAFSRFMIKRVARMYPLHLLCLLLIAGIWVIQAFYIAFSQHLPIATGFDYQFPLDYYKDGRWMQFLAQALMLNGIGFNPNGVYFNGPSWSVSSEVWSNFLIFFVLSVVSKERTKIFFLIVTMLLGYVVLFNSPYSALDVHRENEFGFLNLGLVRACAGLSLGGLVWLLVVQYQRAKAQTQAAVQSPWVVSLIQLVCFVGVLTTMYKTNFVHQNTFTVPIIGAVLAGSLMFQRGTIHRLLSARPFVFLGKISFALYICHYIPQYLVQSFVQPTLGYDKSLVVFVLSSLGLAAFLHFKLENRLNKVVKNWLEKHYSNSQIIDKAN